jgi:translation initiation factor IF-3
MNLAREMELDLVEVADKANPPVVRIMDFGKYKYEASQRARESRKHQASNALKEMKYRPKIGRADFDTKTRSVEKFLGEGHKVKLTIMFRGREVFHPELGMRILERVAEHNAHLAKVEASPRLDGRNMTMVLAPDKRVQAEWARRQAEEAAEAAGGPNGAAAGTDSTDSTDSPDSAPATPPPAAPPQPAPATTAQE